MVYKNITNQRLRIGSIMKGAAYAPKYQQPLMFETLTQPSNTISQKNTSIRKQLSEFIRKVTRFRRKPATHIFVLISSALHNQKPYALPVQCVPYAGIKEVDIRRLVSALVREMVSHGMNVAGKHCFVSLMFLLILVCYLV